MLLVLGPYIQLAWLYHSRFSFENGAKELALFEFKSFSDGHGATLHKLIQIVIREFLQEELPRLKVADSFYYRVLRFISYTSIQSQT